MTSSSRIPTLLQRRFAHSVLVLCLSACSAAPAPPDILLVVLDTTRADFGDAGRMPPRLAELAEDSIVFERAYATSTWTLASHASLFTGLLPASHGATQENLHLAEEVDTLAEILAARGYATAAFTNNSWISASTNLVQGFDEVFELWRDREKGVPKGAGLPHPTNEAVLSWLRARKEGADSETPRFVFVNYLEPHWPYEAPHAYLRRFFENERDPATLTRLLRQGSFAAINWYSKPRPLNPKVLKTRMALYAAEVAYVDAVLGNLIDGLRDIGALDTTLLIVTSDHGENIGENGHFGHSFALYDSTLRVPLIVRPPGGRPGGERRSTPAQITDVFATIAAATNAEQRDERAVGFDLLGSAPPSDRPIVGEYYFPEMFLSRFSKRPKVREKLAPYRRRIRSIQVGNDKLIWGSDGRHELYDTGQDPDESRNRFESEPERAAELEAQLAEIVERLAGAPPAAQHRVESMDEQTLEHLRSLGYLR